MKSPPNSHHDYQECLLAANGEHIQAFAGNIEWKQDRRASILTDCFEEFPGLCVGRVNLEYLVKLLSGLLKT